MAQAGHRDQVKDQRERDRVLTESRRHGQLISILRSEIDSAQIQGFVVDESRDLVLMQCVRDFCLDGISIFRRSDISGVRRRKTDVFQESLLKADGIFDEIDFSSRGPLESFAELLSTLPSEQIVILENETAAEPLFMIGRIEGVDGSLVRFRYFSGAARWDRKSWKVDLDEITTCQLETSYITAYQRHFARKETSAAAASTRIDPRSRQVKPDG